MQINILTNNKIIQNLKKEIEILKQRVEISEKQLKSKEKFIDYSNNLTEELFEKLHKLTYENSLLENELIVLKSKTPATDQSNEGNNFNSESNTMQKNESNESINIQNTANL